MHTATDFATKGDNFTVVRAVSVGMHPSAAPRPIPVCHSEPRLSGAKNLINV